MKKGNYIFLGRLVMIRKSVSGRWTITKPNCQYRPWLFIGRVEVSSGVANLVMIGRWSVTWSSLEDSQCKEESDFAAKFHEKR